MKTPDYSSFARQYALSRPGYPDALFDRLTSLVRRRRLAWDCATGSGQAALKLAQRFDRVVATDISAEQIRHAARHERIRYAVAPADRSGLDAGTVDLVTIASAVHWFDLDTFYAELRRVAAPECVVAAWTYHVGHIEPPFDEFFLRFYRDAVSPHFEAGARLVDQRYENIVLPGQPVEAGSYEVTAHWTLEQLLAFVTSWSGTQSFIAAKGVHPMDPYLSELERLWGDRSTARTLQWPLYLRVSRL